MKLVTFEVSTILGPVVRIGALCQNRVIDLNMGYARYLQGKVESARVYEMATAVLPPDMIGLFRSSREGKEAAQLTIEYTTRELDKGTVAGPQGEKIVYEMGEVKLKAPVPRPNSLRDYFCFEEHASFSGQLKLADQWYQIPVCYKGNPDTVLGTEETILYPSFCDFLDYELEYGIYIGKEGKNIPREKAEEYIAGYTIFNDISCRDIQVVEMACHLGPVKSKDTCSIMGPCLVTPDEVAPSNMRMIARINGEVWSDNNTGTSYWTWPQIIEFASMDETLYPGDFMGSGTVGKGSGVELGRQLQPGDTIELEVEGIGVLRNQVGAKPPKRVFTR